MKPQPIPETMLEAVRQFADPQVAHDFFVQIRFPNGVACPRLGFGSARVAYMPKVMRWYCNECKRQFSAKVGTIFEDSPISLSKCLPAIWLIASNRNGISSYEIARGLKVTQKTAWFMLHRIREAIRDESFEKFGALPVEVDETFVGGKAKAPRNPAGRAVRKGPNYKKTTVMGIVERKGRVRAFVVPSNRRQTLADRIRGHMERGATVYTDGLPSYNRLSEDFIHQAIDHATEYVRGHVHANNIEGFWSVFKRTIRATYIAPRPKHLQAYVEEQVFRFNAHNDGDAPRFVVATKGADGKRLMYKALIAKN